MTRAVASRIAPTRSRSTYRIDRAAGLAGVLLAGLAGPVGGQATSLDSLLRASRHPLSIERGSLGGAGAAVLRAAAEPSQFVALGEEHNTRAIPSFTTALFRILHDQLGFKHLALEEGPALGRLLSNAARAGGADSAVALGLRYPNAFHMYTEDELRMIGDIGRLSTTAAEPIWGLDQEFGALHAFARLVEIAPDASARSAARALLEQASGFERERFQKNVHYMGAVLLPKDLEALREAFRPATGSETDWLIRQLALSNRVYAPYSSSSRSGSALPRVQASNVPRCW